MRHDALMANLRVARALHLIDIENLTGCPRPTAADVVNARLAYEPLVAVGDHVVLACNHGAFLEVEQAWPDARHLVRSGPDGADEALLEVIRHERAADRFTEVLMATGDGGFADTAARLCSEGVVVTVIVGRGQLSNRLRLAAMHLAYLDLDLLPAEATRIRWAA